MWKIWDYVDVTEGKGLKTTTISFGLPAADPSSICLSASATWSLGQQQISQRLCLWYDVPTSDNWWKNRDFTEPAKPSRIFCELESDLKKDKTLSKDKLSLEEWVRLNPTTRLRRWNISANSANETMMHIWTFYFRMYNCKSPVIRAF